MKISLFLLCSLLFLSSALKRSENKGKNLRPLQRIPTDSQEDNYEELRFLQGQGCEYRWVCEWITLPEGELFEQCGKRLVCT